MPSCNCNTIQQINNIIMIHAFFSNGWDQNPNILVLSSQSGKCTFVVD